MGSSPHYREEVCLEYVDEFPLVVRGQWLHVKKKQKMQQCLFARYVKKWYFKLLTQLKQAN